MGTQGFEPTKRPIVPDSAVARVKLPEGPDAELAFVVLHSAGKELMPNRGRMGALFSGRLDRQDEKIGPLMTGESASGAAIAGFGL